MSIGGKIKMATGLAILKKSDSIMITEDIYSDLLDRWAIDDQRAIFVKHCRFKHPIKNRFMIMQIIISKTKKGKIYEGVFEGNAILRNWVHMEYSEKFEMKIPKINLCDGNFAPTEIEYKNFKGNFNFLSIKDQSMLHEMMEYFGLVSVEEIEALKNLTEEEENLILPIIMD